MQIKEWVKAARKSRGMTQPQLGFELSVSKQNVSAWEIGRHEPSYGQLVKIAEITGFPLMAHDVATMGSAAGLDEALQMIAAAIRLVPKDRVSALAENMSGWVRNGAKEPWGGIIRQLLAPPASDVGGADESSSRAAAAADALNSRRSQPSAEPSQKQQKAPRSQGGRHRPPHGEGREA